jgi:putative colanic acid biosynthesis UDP-glucose lipid carrier transferase
MTENVEMGGANAGVADGCVESARDHGAPFVAASAINGMAHHVDVGHDRGGLRAGGDLWLPARGAERRPVGGWSKRAFDVTVASATLVLLAPLLVLIAIAVRLDSPGRSIFKQERGGYGGRVFRIWKFRTMSVTENRGVVQARRNDERITRIGGFLRRSSWDELPQLFNVLAGDMSIIGPRPHAVEHDARFEKIDPRYPVRRRARPGVTGLAQVNGCRGPTETAEKIRARTGFDAEYVRSWSWMGDIQILFRTVALLWKGDPGAL